MDREAESPFEVLGVKPGSTREAIRAARNAELFRWHPDRFMAASSKVQAEAARRTKAINHAYETIEGQGFMAGVRDLTQPSDPDATRRRPGSHQGASDHDPSRSGSHKTYTHDAWEWTNTRRRSPDGGFRQEPDHEGLAAAKKRYDKHKAEGSNRTGKVGRSGGMTVIKAAADLLKGATKFLCLIIQYCGIIYVIGRGFAALF